MLQCPVNNVHGQLQEHYKIPILGLKGTTNYNLAINL